MSGAVRFMPRAVVWSLGGLICALALALGVCCGTAVAAPSPNQFEIVPGSFTLVPSSFQAGAHADWTLSFDLAHEGHGTFRTFNDLRSTLVNFPVGFMGNGNKFSLPTCTLTQLLAQGPPGGIGARCPQASQVGTISFELVLKSAPVEVSSPLYNMEITSFGIASELGFKTVVITQTLPVIVRPSDSGLTGMSLNTEEVGEPRKIVVSLWGVPAAHVHDPQRGQVCTELGEEGVSVCNGGGEEANFPARPFLANPTSCAGTLAESMKAESWEETQPEGWASDTLVEQGPQSAFSTVGPFVECERLHFDPAISIKPSTPDAESPSGLSVALEVPQNWEEPETTVPSNVKDVTVTLPEGYTVNPSNGNGLAGCTPAQYASETAFSKPQCPPESKIGTVEIETPLLAQHIDGNVYIAQPYDNIPAFGDAAHPGGSLLALYVVAKEPQRGVIVKTAGKVVPNAVTGQLTSTFEDLPQQPFSRVVFDLKQGVTSPLASPPACGSYSAQAAMTPYSAPLEPRLVSNSLSIEHGIGGGPCPAGGAPPFSPRVISGTQNNDAGNYSSFYLRINREDGEQEITKFTTILPPGLTANLTGVPFCSDAQIQAAREVTGQQEISKPACPAASEIGHTLVGAGVGGILAWTPGKVYLAGSYHGSALSIVSVTSATVGPFDLGTVVIRFALKINPITGQAEIDGSGSDPIPHIIDGIVVHVRDVHVYIDRSKFMIDPTSCEHLSIANAITGAGANIASSADDQTANVTTPFQAADCSSLTFKPVFKASASGKTSRQTGTSLHVTLSYPSGSLGKYANIKSVKVELPKQLPSRLTTLQKACVDSVFNANPAACPAASRVGTAKAITPILPVPIEGPAYFVSHGGAKFPELIIVLQGYGVTIDLHGETFISKKGITSSTFRSVPDEPVTSFELTLPQGPDSALAANGNLCAVAKTILVKRKVTVRVKGHRKILTRRVRTALPASLAMPTTFTAQNGAVIHQSTPIEVTGCGKARKANAGTHRTRRDVSRGGR